MVTLGENNYIKTVLASVCGVTGYLLNCISEIIVIMGIALIIDFFLGVLVSFKEGRWTVEKGFWGAIKKMGYMVCILLAFLLDFTLNWLLKQSGTEISTSGVFGISTTCYLIGTEGVSILRNLIMLGVPVPKFLSKGFRNLKTKLEDKDKDKE